LAMGCLVLLCQWRHYTFFICFRSPFIPLSVRVGMIGGFVLCIRQSCPASIQLISTIAHKPSRPDSLPPFFSPLFFPSFFPSFPSHVSHGRYLESEFFKQTKKNKKKVH
jgi:hypothetical protein